MDGEKRRKGEVLKGRVGSFSLSPRLSFSASRQRGFTLLELMIVISILVILALIAMAQYNQTVLAAREATLREDLFTMRKMIDQYGADKGKLPQSLSDLQSAGYIHELPIDPMTDQADWQVEFGEDPGSTGGEQGVTNVHSSSSGTASDGSRYNEW
jgi:general secretion pathway protein G